MKSVGANITEFTAKMLATSRSRSNSNSLIYFSFIHSYVNFGDDNKSSLKLMDEWMDEWKIYINKFIYGIYLIINWLINLYIFHSFIH